jgi:hypothetical protein
MKAASISEIKNELKGEPPARLLELCLQLARYKKENKELLTYLLFEAHDLQTYITTVKEEIDQNFENITTTNLYIAKKNLRKILRTTNKYIRYTGSKVAETELLVYFCKRLKDSKIPIRKSTALINLYNSQLKKIGTAVSTLHEDLQHDYLLELQQLQ